MTRMEEIKKFVIVTSPERKDNFEEEHIRLKIAVMVVELREKYELSQQMLAEKSGVPRSTIVRIENAQVNTTVHTLNKLANAVNKKIEMTLV